MWVRRAAVFGSLISACTALPAHGQFSSDIPGIPRAGAPVAGARQHRTEIDLTWFKVPVEAGGDSTAYGFRMGMGRSYRIRPRLEAGFDFTLVDVAHVRMPGDGGAGEPAKFTRGLVFYGLRLGVKYAPIAALSPEGYGYQAALGLAIRPPLEPLFGASGTAGDSTRTGGLFTDEGEDEGWVGELSRSIQGTVLVSYRNRRWTADAGLLLESSREDSTSAAGPAVTRYSGVSPRVGATYRLTPSFSVGGAWWGNGAPPWRDRVRQHVPQEDTQSIGAVLSFGSRPESGTDLMIMSPTGDFGQALRLYLRVRSTR